MDGTRRVATLSGCGELTVEERPMPGPGRGEVLVEVAASLLSPGTEGTIIRNRRDDPDPSAEPTPIGYQNAGRVRETGDGVDRFEPGDRVACLGAGYAYHADHVVVPVNLCVDLPEGVSFEEGAFTNLGATALHSVRRADPEVGAAVAVIGLGIVGQLVGQISRIAGCRVLGSDLLDFRVELAKDSGFDRAGSVSGEAFVEAAEEFTRDRGLDGGFLCIGGDGTDAFRDLVAAMQEAPDTHTMGWIVVAGGLELAIDFPASLGNIDIRNAARSGPGYHDPAWERGDEYPDGHVRWTARENLEKLVEWIDDGRLETAPLVTDRYPLSRIDDAYEQIMARPDESLGVIVRPE